MAIKTFRGKSVNEALAMVKRELGPNAVILHTKTHKVGGVFGIGAHSVTEITATADASVVRSMQARSSSRAPSRSEPSPVASEYSDAQRKATRRELLEYARSAVPSANAATEHRSGDRSEARGRPVSGPPLDPLDPLAALFSRKSVSDEPAVRDRQRESDPGRQERSAGPSDRPAAAPTPQRHSVRHEPEPSRESDPLRERTHRLPAEPEKTPKAQPIDPSAVARPSGAIEAELAALRRMVTQVLQTSRAGATGFPSDALTDVYAKLIENELAADLADEIATEVRQELSRHELDSPDIVRQAVLRHLASHIPVSRSLTPAGIQEDGRPLTIALIGPTGVGKTTTLAKLAATYKLRRGKKVGMVTCDTYRIAAVDQLRTYANIIGLPLKVALTPADMRQACQQLSDCDVILVDTAGRSQRDVGKIDELRTLIDAAAPHETHLVLSSTHSERVLAEAAAKFVDIQPDHVIFTKLDEAVSLGLVVNTLRRLNARLSFVTTGQEVPDQIELGNADRIARLVVDGGVAR